MLFFFFEGVQIMPSNHLECYLFLEGVQIMPSNHLQCYLFFILCFTYHSLLLFYLCGLTLSDF